MYYNAQKRQNNHIHYYYRHMDIHRKAIQPKGNNSLSNKNNFLKKKDKDNYDRQNPMQKITDYATRVPIK